MKRSRPKFMAEFKAKVAVAVVKGDRPLAVTNCLNFGNPYKPEVYYLFAECVRGMGEACRVFETPVTGGNVSFYNEDAERAVYPTPVIGMVGLIDNVAHITTQWFKNEGDMIVLVGENQEDLGGSEYLKTIHNLVTGDAPYLDLEKERRVGKFVLDAIRKGLVNSAHDVSDGGLAVCLAECCITNPDRLFGCKINLKSAMRPDALWFGEAQSRVVVSLPAENYTQLVKLASQYNVGIATLGEVTAGVFEFADYGSLDPAELKERYYSCLPKLMERSA